jgi:PAS domain S-box-containing protein
VANQKPRNRSEQLLKTLNRIQREFILHDEPRAAFEILLESLLEFTGSEYGFVGEVLRDEDDAPYLKTYAISDIAWNEETRKFYDEYRDTGMEFHNLETLFGKVLSTGKHIIANEPATHPDRGGLPPGHPSLDAFLGLPIFAGKEFAGMAGIANRKDGYDESVIESIQPLLEAGAYMIAASREKQRRKSIERDLNTNLMLRHSMIDSALDCVIGMDHEGNIFEFNPAAEQTFGWSRSEVLGRPLADVIIPEDLRDAHRNGFERYLITGEGPVIGKRIEVAAIRRDGERFPVELSIAEILSGADDQPLFISYLRDITERKHTEAAITAAKESAEAASHAKSSFVSTISHEIRTPLNAIMGALGLLDREQMDADSRVFLRTAQTSADALLGLVNDVLDFSRIEAAQMPLEPVSFPVAALCDGVIQVLSQKAASSKTDIGCVVHEGVPATVTADLGKIRQVLLNLVGNAVKFCDGGEVLVQVRPDDAGISFAVSDTGVGISEEDIDRLFEEFAQVGDQRLRGGAGLGLAISKRLVDLIGGEINVKSELDHGSTFSFSVPYSESGSDQHPTANFANKRIVIVGNDDFHRNILDMQLEAWGTESSQADYSSNALDKLVKKNTADAVIIINNRPLSKEDTAKLAKLIESCRKHEVPMILAERPSDSGIESLAQYHDFSSSLPLPLSLEEIMSALAFAFDDTSESQRLRQTSEFSRLAVANGVRVLLAEDSQANRLIVAEILRRDGFTVDVAADGVEAAQAAENLPYHVVLMDIDMPEMDGVQATRTIRQSQSEHNQVPIIALTAHASAEDRERFVLEGMNDYVSKPIDRDLLFDKIVHWAGRSTDQDMVVDEGGHEEERAPTSSDELIDRKALLQLAEDTSPATALRLIAVFIKELQSRTMQIAEFHDLGDMDGLASQAHALKSSAATYGAAVVRERTLRLDNACSCSDQKAAMAAAQELLAVVEPTVKALNAYLAEIGANVDTDNSHLE